jgi:hypothetical protein
VVKKLKKLKVDHVGEFVDAGHEGVDDDEGRVEEEKRTNHNHNILGRVDKEYKVLKCLLMRRFIHKKQLRG